MIYTNKQGVKKIMGTKNKGIEKKNQINPSCKKWIYLVITLMSFQFFTGCALVRGVVEGTIAIMEAPSMELVLDRLNTASCISMTAKAVVNDIPISVDSKWPEAMESFPKNQIAEIMRVLAIDRAYSDNGGAISPIKAHLVQVQSILYDVPPDLYAKHGSCYAVGEETFVNNYYFKILGGGNFIKKANPTGEEMEAALKNAFNQFLDVGKPVCNTHNTFYKRKGKYRDALVNRIATENGYKNITAAIIGVLENYNAKDVTDLKNALDEINTVKEEIDSINVQTMSLENKKFLLKNNEPVVGYNSIDKIENDLALKQKDLEAKKERLTELQLITDKAFENIQNDLPVVSANDLAMLEKISAACKAVNGLLIDSMSLTTIALAKTPSSLLGIRDELKRMTARKSINPFIPIRIARLKSNAGNVFSNIKTIVLVLKKERSMVSSIKSTADQIIKLTRKSLEQDGELPKQHTIVDSVDESSVLADTETTSDVTPIPLESQDFDEEPDIADIEPSEKVEMEPQEHIEEAPEEIVKAEVETETPEIEPVQPQISRVEPIPAETIVQNTESKIVSALPE